MTDKDKINQKHLNLSQQVANLAKVTRTKVAITKAEFITLTQIQ
jgi:hypothetical protein